MKFFTLGFTLFALLVVMTSAHAAPLTKAIDVRSLSVARAQEGLEVSLRAVVTFTEPGTVYVQDETAGTFLRLTEPSTLRPGDEIEVRGRTRSGLYLPGIAPESFRILRHGVMPDPVPGSYDDLVSGRLHYQRVAIEGIVRSLAPLEEGRSLMRIALGSRGVEIRIEAAPERGASVVGSRVRVAGLVAGVINDRHQLVQPYLRVSDWSDVSILVPAVPDNEVAAISAATLLAFDVSGQDGKRIHISGTVTATFRDGTVFLKNGQAAFGVRLVAAASLEVGDDIEVLGFPEMGRISAFVADSVLIRRQRGTPPVAIEIEDAAQLRTGHDGSLVAVTGIVASWYRTDRGVALVLQGSTRTIQARVPEPVVDLAVGTLVRLVGICQVESATGTPTYNTQVEVVGVRARTAQDLTVLRSPSWWTVRRLAAVLAVFAAATVLGGLWIMVLRRQVTRQTAALRRRIEAEAVLDERQRIAREFHDSLEQELAGLRLRLDALATRAIDDKGREIVGTSRSLLARIQVETHNLISDLRDAAENAGDLGAVLETLAASHAAGDSAVQVRTDIAARIPLLPESTVHHLRMIARESVNNALKHAAAKQVVLQIRADDTHLVLSIGDDGCGFDADVAVRGKAGHFGCMGIRERADRIGGVVAWRSSPGRGTTVEVRLPLPCGEREASESPSLVLAARTDEAQR